MEQAIKKAIEGGYKIIDTELSIECRECFSQTYEQVHELALLDPAFWQALGKVMGWKEAKQYIHQFCRYDDCYDEQDDDVEQFKVNRPEIWEKIKGGEDYSDGAMGYRLYKGTNGYIKHWHSFIDALACGKSADEFFSNLLK